MDRAGNDPVGNIMQFTVDTAINAIQRDGVEHGTVLNENFENLDEDTNDERSC